jgi:hypothetical protein
MPKHTSKPLSERLLDRLKNKRFVAYLVVAAAILGGLATASESLSKIYSLIVASTRDGATAVVLPKDTGWILGGYYDGDASAFTEGPFFKIIRTSYPTKEPVPRLGDQLKLTSPRNIIIADFETMGLTRRFDPPWQQNVLKESDYTGLKLPTGVVVEVRDVSLGAVPGRPSAVWIRIGNPQ